MSAGDPPPPSEPRTFAEEDEGARFSAVVGRLAVGDRARLTLDELVTAFGERAFGAVLLLVSLLNLIPIPGGTTITGIPLGLVAAQLALGRDRLWLPRALRRASLSREHFAKGVARVRPWLERAERLTRPRLPALVGPVAERLIGAVALAFAFVLILPIPGGNFPPALTCALFGLALMQRDGAAALAGWGAATVSVAILALVWKTVEAAVVHLLRLF